MSEFVQGQRWVVDSEPELGLGTLTAIEGRTIKIFFELGDCERTYAIQQAPLTRIYYSVEDEIKTLDGSIETVTDVLQQDGLFFYQLASGKVIPETQLSSEIQLNQPFMRLMTGQLDKPNWFSFKRKLSDAISRVWQSRLNGLLGVRANLIPHQLYVAWNSCEREHVRVLLADEVGLGKTIEAGMILSRLIKLERVQRVLIAVPDALQVQWLVELVRRFSLAPELFKGEEHDFHAGQIHIIPHSILSQEREKIVSGEFDLVIVDEAHHLTPDSDAFITLKDLSDAIEHFILLTATPEQLGIESHFARLQLLDPAKFTSLDEFVSQEEKFIQLNQDIKNLPDSRNKIIEEYQLELDDNASDELLVNQLLDCHGVGRVMSRNVRSAIKGFPSRIAHPHLVENDGWDDKYEWLAQFLKAKSEEKILVICHDIDHVYACETYLWKKHGLDAAVFHEEQTLIERDKAAAYFSDEEQGAQVLICSEIGSEGRNFQFSSHLVCLDLPQHPDLLEQRIGRLDRIGQKRDVNIHIPFSEGSESAIYFTWYHEILSCIEQQNPAATTVHDEFWTQINGDLTQESLISAAKNRLNTLAEEISQGRDALLEMNSCRQPMADALAEKIDAFEHDSPLPLVELASELLQFYFEETQTGAYSIIPSDKMLIPSLPGIPPEGTEITFDRDLANHREDLRFVSWDAPLIQGLWDLLHYSELGSASVAMLVSRQLPAGHCLLETCFDVVIQSEHAAACRPFLKAMTVRSLAIDISDNDLSEALPEKALQDSIKDVKRHLGREIIKSKKEEIPDWFKKAEVFAEKQKLTLIDDAVVNASQYFDQEILRLEKLQQRNNTVDDNEIAEMKAKSNAIIDALKNHAALHLSAIRLIVISDA